MASLIILVNNRYEKYLSFFKIWAQRFSWILMPNVKFKCWMDSIVLTQYFSDPFHFSMYFNSRSHMFGQILLGCRKVQNKMEKNLIEFSSLQFTNLFFRRVTISFQNWTMMSIGKCWETSNIASWLLIWLCSFQTKLGFLIS